MYAIKQNKLTQSEFKLNPPTPGCFSTHTHSLGDSFEIFSAKGGRCNLVI